MSLKLSHSRMGSEVSPVLRRSTAPRPGLAVAALLIGLLAAVPAPVAGWADPGVTDTGTPGAGTPTATGTGATAAPTGTSTPVGNPTPTPNPPPTTPGAATEAPGTLAVTVQSSNAVLGTGYWSGNRASSFVITIHNTGNVAAHTALTYTLPPGVSGVATGECPRGACTVDAEPGKTVSLTVGLTVSPDAWRTAPLAGKINFSATAPRVSPATGVVNWSVVFPPGPPAPGIALQVADVTLDSDATDPGELVIRLTNTGGRPGSAVIDVVVPAGVDVTALPAECQSQRRIDATTTECGLGILGAGVQRAIGVPLKVSDSSRAGSPLAGLVRATLTPSGQASRSTQASYQIIAPPAQAGINAVTVPSVAPSSPGPVREGSPLALPIILGSILVLALVGVGLVLRLDGRISWRQGRFRRKTTVYSARTGPWRPVATFVPPLPTQPTGPPAHLNGATAEPVNAEAPSVGTADGDGAPDKPEPVEAEAPQVPDPVSLAWTELPDSTPPPGRSVR